MAMVCAASGATSMADHRSAPIEAFIVGLSSGWND
jgi:hypothetical protein